MAKYRKKPIVIEAWQWDGRASAQAKAVGQIIYDKHKTEFILIKTLEGDMRADPGDWIITGVKGERYPCKPDIFEATYEPVVESPMAEQNDARRLAAKMRRRDPLNYEELDIAADLLGQQAEHEACRADYAKTEGELRDRLAAYESAAREGGLSEDDRKFAEMSARQSSVAARVLAAHDALAAKLAEAKEDRDGWMSLAAKYEGEIEQLRARVGMIAVAALDAKQAPAEAGTGGHNPNSPALRQTTVITGTDQPPADAGAEEAKP